MSTIKTNKLALTANGASEFTLPQTDGSAGQVLQTDGSGNLSWVTPASSTQGISVAKQFRMHTTYTLPTNSRVTVNDYWESIDTDTPGVLGSFADPSSGVFAFPSTGIWLIQWQAYFLAGTGTSSECFITTTTDNSSYDVAASARFEAHDGGDYHSPNCFFLFDVTNVSTHKVKLDAYSRWASTQIRGDTNSNITYATFVKLGDT